LQSEASIQCVLVLLKRSQTRLVVSIFPGCIRLAIRIARFAKRETNEKAARQKAAFSFKGE